MLNGYNQFFETFLKDNAIKYALSNILSISLLLDMGIKGELDINIIENNLNGLGYNIADKDEIMDLTGKLKPNVLVYSKADIKNPDADDIVLEFSNIDKTIYTKQQALLIINEIMLAEFLFDNSIFNNSINPNIEIILAVILMETSIHRMDYLLKNLIHEDGYFFSHEGSSSFNYEDQGYILLALYKLYDVLYQRKSIHYPEILEFGIIKNTMKIIIDNLLLDEEEILGLETYKLCDLISSISQVDYIEEGVNLKYLVASFAEELSSREFMNGYISKYQLENKPASLETHFRAVDALIEAYNYTEFSIYIETSNLIYRNLDSLWDNEIQLYKLKNSNKVKYTARNIAYMISALYKLIINSKDEEECNSLIIQLKGLITSALRETGLQRQPVIFANVNREKHYDSIDEIFEELKNSIILKGFKINLSRNKILLDKEFSIEYALLFSNSMLNILNNPNIHGKNALSIP